MSTTYQEIGLRKDLQDVKAALENSEARLETALRELARVSEERDSYKLTLEQCAGTGE